MAYQKPLMTDTVVAGADLSGLQYKAVTVGGTLGTSNAASYGILQNKPESGEGGTVTVIGLAKAIAGGAITAGVNVTVSSGFLIAVSSGDGVTVGKAKIAANSGDTFTAAVNFLNGGIST